MKSEIIYNTIGKLSTALTTLLILPFVGYFFGDYYLGLYGIFATITIVILVLEGGLSSSFISDLAKCRDNLYKPAVSVFIVDYFLIFLLIGLVSAFIVFIFGMISVFLVESLKAYDDKDELFLLYSLLSFLSILALYFQSLAYGTGVQKFYNITISFFSLSRIFLPLALYVVGFSISYIGFIYLILILNSLCVFVLFCHAMSVGFLKFNNYKFLGSSHVKNGFRSGFPVFLVSLSSIFYTQLDKIFGMNLLSLEIFGVYTTASSLASAPMILAGIIYSVMLPRFSALSSGSKESLVYYYKKYSKVLLFILLFFYVIAVSSSFFALNVTYVDFLLVDGSYNFFLLCFSILLLGSIFQAYTALPYALQVSSKNVGSTLKLNYMLMPIFFLIMYFLSNILGYMFLPFFWLLYNVVFLIALYYIFIRPFKRSELNS